MAPSCGHQGNHFVCVWPLLISDFHSFIGSSFCIHWLILAHVSTMRRVGVKVAHICCSSEKAPGGSSDLREDFFL